MPFGRPRVCVPSPSIITNCVFLDESTNRRMRTRMSGGVSPPWGVRPGRESGRPALPTRFHSRGRTRPSSRLAHRGRALGPRAGWGKPPASGLWASIRWTPRRHTPCSQVLPPYITRRCQDSARRDLYLDRAPAVSHSEQLWSRRCVLQMSFLSCLGWGRATPTDSRTAGTSPFRWITSFPPAVNFPEDTVVGLA